MKELLIATKNPGKFMEIGEVLGDLPLRLIFLGDLEVDDGDFEEDGETFADNARKKALYYGNIFNLPTIGEDSGILVDALPGELGVKTRRWGAGPLANDEEWIAHFFERMAREENRGAQFVCNACLVVDGAVISFEGMSRGILTAALEAPIVPGIPLSSCFRPLGQEKVFAALSEKEKNAISHRGQAFKALKDHLSALLADK